MSDLGRPLPQPTGQVEWLASPLGDAIKSSLEARLKVLIQDRDSEPLAIFSPEARETAASGDWYGEHLGKWLCAACLAWQRTKDPELKNSIAEAVLCLNQWQEEDGYLGTYGTESTSRLTNDLASEVRTWDVWIHSWAIRGLLAAHRSGIEGELALKTLNKAGDLLVSEINRRGKEFLLLGNHKGLSAAIAVDALAEMGSFTGRQDCLEAATSLLGFLESSGIAVLSGPNCDLDAAQLGTGKAYQIIWVLLGMAKLAKAKSDTNLLEVVRYWWQNIKSHHMTPFGGPWGGIGGHFEVFNQKGFFSPEGMVETCSTATWISLSRELYAQTGCPLYLQACERSLLNGILGAIDENGRDWSYFTFPNGRRNSTYHWACCRSSGALALEEAALLPLWKTEIGLRLALLQPMRVNHEMASFAVHQISMTNWEIEILESSSQTWTLEILIPDWADSLEITDNEGRFLGERDGFCLCLPGQKKQGDKFELHFSVKPRVNCFTDTRDHHGQEIVRTDYACLTWGPYVYATGLIDGYRKQETLRIAKLFPLNSFLPEPGTHFPTYKMRGQGRSMIELEPYFQAGGRHDGAWRALWLQVAWQ